jgi:hypothetical protein
VPSRSFREVLPVKMVCRTCVAEFSSRVVQRRPKPHSVGWSINCAASAAADSAGGYFRTSLWADTRVKRFHIFLSLDDPRWITVIEAAERQLKLLEQ